MSRRTLEFGVAGVSHVDGRTLVRGRIHSGPLRVGDRFSVVFRLVPTKGPDGYELSRRTGERAVSFRVESIHAYRRAFDELEAGMTAELVLSGEEAHGLDEGDVLAATRFDEGDDAV